MNGLQTFPKDHKLNGKIKSISYHSVKENETPSEANINWKNFFDEKQRLTRTDTYSKSQFLVMTNTNTATTTPLPNMRTSINRVKK